jgi:large conductance mechanosensitive channel
MFPLDKNFVILKITIRNIRNGGLNMLKEFKEFAMKGNVIDLAVGVIIGAAFNKIVSSLVKDIISPILGLFIGGIKLEDVTLPIGNILSLNVGLFLQAVIDFLIISFSIFMIIKGISYLRKKPEKEEKIEVNIEVAPVPSKEEILLAEIRDILKQQQSS